MRPIIESHCLECHSAEKRKGGLSLATYADALDGGRNGAVIRPGNSTGSLIVQRLLGRLDPQMPKDEDPLPAATIALIRRWIDQGARETPTSPPAPPPWDAPLASHTTGGAADRLVKMERTDRPIHRCLPVRPWRRRTLDRGRRALRASRLPRYLGPASSTRCPCRLPESDRRGQARRSSCARCSRTTRNTPSTGSRSGTTCCATRTASPTTRRPQPARASPPGCSRRSSPTFPTIGS